ncbi:HPr kinase/phosphorylase [Amaricoccus solimangrovi]|uniref:Serine kinase n=1 Tax=Amaricoccus solimangrovi TaxID=2589815 RepID=A0A501WHP0_9RHOB|nr:HPr kinase/phosphatase C-terminal domain-containing protein [Amaricoccus solimangrovi]TPE48302.1 serine kinase [Amaricoccus solimangrovi]
MPDRSPPDASLSGPPAPARLVAHAAAVAIDGRAVLIQGASGSGKSGLALRLIALGGVLVADDRVALERRGASVIARAVDPLRGLVEARGVGLLRTDQVLDDVAIATVVDLDFAPAARMPQLRVIDLLGTDVELIFGRGVPNLDAVLVFMMRNARYQEK